MYFLYIQFQKLLNILLKVVEIIRKIIVSILAFAAFAFLMYNVLLPGHLDANLEMQHCGGCHSEESTIRMHDYADPMERACVECHPNTATGLSVHAEMVPSECGRCHEFGDKPTYAECDLCHSEHYHVEAGIDAGDQDCITCHLEHSILTDRECAKCHREEYDILKASGDKHSDRPDSCYTCHTEHKYIPTCLDCHEEILHGDAIQSNCTECHQQHMPKALYFSPLIVSEECAKCHPAVYLDFQDNPSKHADLQCVDCHQQHQLWRECRDCHPETHPEYMEYKVDKCLECHRDQHSPSKYGFESGYLN